MAFDQKLLQWSASESKSSKWCAAEAGEAEAGVCTKHTPPERLPGSVQCPRPMTFTQLFFGISGTQNRKNQNFLTSPFFVIEILRYPTFPYCFYYIAILQLIHFREIFTLFLASSDKIYLESSYFLRYFLTSIANG